LRNPSATKIETLQIRFTNLPVFLNSEREEGGRERRPRKRGKGRKGSAPGVAISIWPFIIASERRRGEKKKFPKKGKKGKKGGGGEKGTNGQKPNRLGRTTLLRLCYRRKKMSEKRKGERDGKQRRRIMVMYIDLLGLWREEGENPVGKEEEAREIKLQAQRDILPGNEEGRREGKKNREKKTCVNHNSKNNRFHH